MRGQAPDALHRLHDLVDELAHVGGGKVARDAVHAGAVRPVGRELDLDHGIVEPRPLCVDFAERRVGGQFDDALVVLGELHLELGHQHAATFDAADLADAERDVLARDVGADRHEHAHHAALGIGRAAHDLHRIAGAGVDHAHPQPVGIGMRLRLDDARDGERRQQRALVGEAFDLEPDHGELVGDRRDRGVGVEMLLEPGQREFHQPALCDCGTRDGASSVCSLPRLRGRGGEGACVTAAAIVSNTPSRLVITS